MSENYKGIAPVGKTAGRRQYLRVPKNMIWFWQEFDSQIQVIYSLFLQIKLLHEDENLEDNEGDMMVEINNLPSKSLRASGTLREKPR